MKRCRLLCIIAMLVIFGSPPILQAAPGGHEVEKPKPPASLTVAILDFEANTPANPELGKQIGEALTSLLSGEEGFTLVDRASIDHILKENELNITGLVSAEQSVKIGRLVGAKILITGKIFPIDKQLFFTAKLIGTETSLVDGVLVKGDKDADVGELMMKLCEKLSTRLREAGPKLVARDDALEDPLPLLKKALMGRRLPRVAVQIQERHVTTAPATRVDPAVETEVQMVLKEAGFSITEGDEKDLAEAGVTLIISGDAFSEFAARIGNLYSCTARVEIKITDRKTKEVLYTDRETTRGVDLAENLAGKAALQKAGRLLAIRILRHFNETLSTEKANPDVNDHPHKKKSDRE